MRVERNSDSPAGPDGDAPVSVSEAAAARAARLAKIRSEIAAGTYDTPERFERAVDRMVSRW